jgi:hypothetical protein
MKSILFPLFSNLRARSVNLRKNRMEFRKVVGEKGSEGVSWRTCLVIQESVADDSGADQRHLLTQLLSQLLLFIFFDNLIRRYGARS